MPSTRLPWIDHLRTFVILLVVNLHACVTYSHVGDWYVMSEHEPSLTEKIPFILWEGHLQSFFMGLLFFVSGYFTTGSLARRGPAAFVRERLVRLGLPALLYMVAIHPFIVLVLNPWHNDYASRGAWYVRFLTSGRFIGSSGPLWFAFALLIFCLVLAAVYAARGTSKTASAQTAAAAPAASRLWFFAVGLAVGSFAMRLVQPIGTNILNMQLCFFVQYVAAFVVGLHAARHGWLLPLAASARARTAGWIALIGGPLLLLGLMLTGRSADGLQVFFGGWHWQAFGFAFWEQCAGVGLSLGLLSWFSRRLNRDTPRLRWLADRCFGVYVLHAPVLVALTIAFRALPQNPYLLAALLTVTGLLASFLVADITKRIPGLRGIL